MPGGIVNIETILSQIASVKVGLDSIVDAVLDSCNVTVTAAKCKVAKFKIKSLTKLMTSLLVDVQNSINEMMSSIDASQFNKSLSELIADPSKFLTSANGSSQNILLLANAKSGLLELLLGLVDAMNIFIEMSIPSARKLNKQGKNIIAAISSLKEVIQSMVDDITSISSNMKNFATIENDLNTLSKTFAKIAELFGSMSILAKAGTKLAAQSPLVIKTMVVFGQTVRQIVMILTVIGDAKQLMQAQKSILIIQRLITSILICITSVTKTMAMLALMLITVALLGVLIVMLFLPFVVGLGAVMILFGVLYVTLKIINKLAKYAVRQSLILLLQVVIITTVFLILSFVIVMLATVGSIISDSLGDVLRALIGIGMILLAMIGLMLLASSLTAVLGIGILALGLLMVATIVLLGVIISLMLLAYFAQMLDAELVVEATKKVISVAQEVIQAIFNAELYKKDEEKQDQGLIQSVIGFIGGNQLLSIMDLMLKIAILFLTVIAVGVMIVLTMVLVEFTEFYLENQKAIEDSPTIIATVLDSCFAIIQTVLDSKADSKLDDSDGVFLQLVGFVLGNEVVAIFKLLFKVVIIMLTIVVLLMIRVVMEELIWIYNRYQELGGAGFFGTGGTASQAISSIISGCYEIIRAVLETPAYTIGEDDGVFLALVGFVLGEDVVVIFKLLFKVVIMLLTIVVLLMVRLLMEELVWIYNRYEELGGAGAFGSGGTIPTAISNIMAGCGEIIAAILDPNTEQMTEGDGIFATLVRFFFGELADVVNLLFKIIKIGVTMMALAVIKCLVETMSKVYETYISLGGDSLRPNVTNMVQSIMGASDDIIRILTQPVEDPNGEPKSGMDKLLEFCGLSNLASVIKLLCSFVRIGLSIVALMVLMSVTKIMKQSWDTYQSMGGANIATNATKMVNGIVNGLNGMIAAMRSARVSFGNASRRTPADVLHPSNVAYNTVLDLIEGLFGKGLTGLIDVMNAAGELKAAIPVLSSIMSILKFSNKAFSKVKQELDQFNSSRVYVGGVIGSIQGLLKYVSQVNIVEADKARKNLQSIETVCKDVASSFNRMLDIKTGFTDLTKQAEQFKSITISTGVLINKINGLDISKVTALAKMFGNAAAFSRAIDGNFDKLADVINEKIAPLLEGLKQAIEEADKHIQENKDNNDSTDKKETPESENTNMQIVPLNTQRNQRTITTQELKQLLQSITLRVKS